MRYLIIMLRAATEVLEEVRSNRFLPQWVILTLYTIMTEFLTSKVRQYVSNKRGLINFGSNNTETARYDTGSRMQHSVQAVQRV